MTLVQSPMGPKYFTRMDGKPGYWVVWLEKECSLLKTFNAPYGKLRWLQLPLVISQLRCLPGEAVIKTVSGVTGTADDVWTRETDKL